MKNPKVSVIIPTYNRAHLIGRAIQSVINQTYQDFEVIVVDDGSTDNTEEIVSSFNDSRIVFESFPQNQGVSVARNRGLDLAKGKYIVFLDDDDDELLPNSLEIFLKLWKEVKDEKVGNIVTRCLDSKTGQKIGYLEKDNLILSYKDIICEKKARGEFHSCWKKEAIGKERFEENIIGCESILWWRLAKKYKFLYKDVPTRIYYHREKGKEGLTSVNSVIRNASKLALGREILLKENSEFLKKYCPERYYHHLLACTWYHLLSGNRVRTRQLIRNFFKAKIFSLTPLGLYFLSFAPKSFVIFVSKLRAEIRNKFKH